MKNIYGQQTLKFSNPSILSLTRDRISDLLISLSRFSMSLSSLSPELLKK